MKKLSLYTVFGAIALSGCAASPQFMAQQSNWDVCRFTMGGPHSGLAQSEAQRRGLNCASMYSAISAQNQAQTAATANLIRSMQPPPAQQPLSCTSRQVGNNVQTDCR